MNKIIIQNKTDMTDEEALKFVQICYDGIDKYSFWKFIGGIKVQVVKKKTCTTFYVYGRKEVEKDDNR